MSCFVIFVDLLTTPFSIFRKGKPLVGRGSACAPVCMGRGSAHAPVCMLGERLTMGIIAMMHLACIGDGLLLSRNSLTELG